MAATDLDGTLIRTDGSVSRRTCEAMRAAEAAGIVLALVTGRPPRWMAPVAQATGHTGIAVCANGALLYDLHTETVVDSTLIEPAVLQQVVAQLRAVAPGLSFAAEYAPGFGHEPAYKHHWDLGVTDVRVGPAERILDRPAAKLLARHPTMACDELLALAVEVGGGEPDQAGSSTSRPPSHGRSAAGTRIEPSGRWCASSRQAMVRVTAHSVPLRVAAVCGLPFSSR